MTPIIISWYKDSMRAKKSNIIDGKGETKMIYRIVIAKGVRAWWDDSLEEYVPGFDMYTEEYENPNDSMWLDNSGLTTTSN